MATTKKDAKTILAKLTQGYGYKYTDLATIHKFLQDTGQFYRQYIERIDGDDYIFTQPMVLDENGKLVKDGEALQGSRVIKAELSGKSNPAQENGSALTYARRYSLLMAYGLATEDDDGETFTRIKPKNTPTNNTSNDKIDFDKLRQEIKHATSREEVELIYKGIPKGLQKYFMKNCLDRVKELKGQD